MPAPSLLVAFGTISTGGGNAINPTLTLMWPIPQISSWSGYRMSSVSSCGSKESKDTPMPAQREKSLFLPLPHCPKWPSLGTLPVENHSTTHNAILLLCSNPGKDAGRSSSKNLQAASAKMVTPPLWLGPSHRPWTASQSQ